MQFQIVRQGPSLVSQTSKGPNFRMTLALTASSRAVAHLRTEILIRATATQVWSILADTRPATPTGTPSSARSTARS